MQSAFPVQFYLWVSDEGALDLFNRVSHRHAKKKMRKKFRKLYKEINFYLVCFIVNHQTDYLHFYLL